MLIIGIIITYYIYNLLCPNKQCPSNLNQFTVGRFKIHLHHWIIHFFILIIYINFSNNLYPILLGLIAGGILHGLIEYSDRFDIIKQT